MVNRIKFLGDLLPSDASVKTSKNDVDQGLKQYRVLLTIAKEAMDAIQAGSLEKFDALVGENACQVRAVKVALLYPKYQPLQIALDQNLIFERGKSLADLIRRVDIALRSDDLFLIGSYLLCKAKSSQEKSLLLEEVESVAPLINGDDSLNKFAHKLVTKTRKILSEMSVDFVQSLSRYYQVQMCSITTPNALQCTPMFWTYKTLLLNAKDSGIPIIFKAKFQQDVEHLHRPQIALS